MRLRQTKRFCTTKENYQQNERQPTEWEKIFANHISYEELIYKIYKALIQLSTRKQNKTQNQPTNNPIKNGKGPE